MTSSGIRWNWNSFFGYELLKCHKDSASHRFFCQNHFALIEGCFNLRFIRPFLTAKSWIRFTWFRQLLKAKSLLWEKVSSSKAVIQKATIWSHVDGFFLPKKVCPMLPLSNCMGRVILNNKSKSTKEEFAWGFLAAAVNVWDSRSICFVHKSWIFKIYWKELWPNKFWYITNQTFHLWWSKKS